MTTKNVTDENFETEVLKATKPTIVDFWADWCAPCKQIAPLFEKLASESKVKFVTAPIDKPGMNDLAKKAGVTCVPYFLTLSDGVKVNSFFGADPTRLKAEVALF